MYVWCDALSNYITALGYGTDAFDKDMWENGTHVIGKDILRFHAAIWPGMLLSAGLPLPKRILVHGFITSGGQKMSKSLGNTISPEDILNLFSPACGELAGEAARFVLLHEVPTFEDGDITIDSIQASYTAHLANGIGNLTNRVLKMAITNNVSIADWQVSAGDKDMYASLESFDIKKAAEYIMQAVRVLDQRIQKEEPFKVVKIDKEKGAEIILYTLVELHSIANQLSIFMPKTSAKILECIRENKMPEKPLFNRLA
jgi:methionyl-tRNA synthetase